jgi:N-methylhydantoinase A/oxoprolinase/acetone carboxylase beta subunit
MAEARFRAGCDIGGTFTDFVLIDVVSGKVDTAKRLTTPRDPSLAMLAGLKGLEQVASRYPAADRRTSHR